MGYTLRFTQEQLVVLNQALQGLPFKVAASFIDNINTQIKEQDQAEIDKTERNK